VPRDNLPQQLFAFSPMTLQLGHTRAAALLVVRYFEGENERRKQAIAGTERRPPDRRGRSDSPVPSVMWGEDSIGGNRMKHVDAQRESAHAQIQRTVKVWRSVKEGASAPINPEKNHLMPKYRGSVDGDDEEHDEDHMKGGSIKDRDKWFGLESKPDFAQFKAWWHRIGKKQMGGQDLTKDTAQEAYTSYQADKNKPK
jgi:hypothetical protein